nr:ferrous iron transporter B [Clostridia bacterium]
MTGNICLFGAPNCGKTTLFNLLTGKNERVGNRAGVSVEEKSGRYKKDKSVIITDLPGTYSLKGVSVDEKIALQGLLRKPQTVISVIDGTDLERGLRLICELLTLDIPMVVAINFSDEMEKQGVKADIKRLSQIFGVPFVLISARKNRGVGELMDIALNRTAVCALQKKFDDKFIAQAIAAAVKTAPTGENFTDKADKILMNKYLGIPVFIAVITAVYCLTALLGGFLGDKVSAAFVRFGNASERALIAGGVPTPLVSLIVNAVIKGVGEVLSFTPQILVLFFLLALIEESGYMARVAFLFDGLMEKVGLGGKSLISLGLSCGCAVSGVMSSRTLENDSRRRLTVYLSPFMPCGAKTAVFAWLSALVFGGNPFIGASLYFLSLFAVAAGGLFLKRFNRFNGGAGLIMEIPVLRVPSFRGVYGALKEKTLDFILKAGSVIFLVSVAVWFLQNFGFHGYTADIYDSFLFFIGDKIKYIFAPLGFSGWQTSVAVVASVFAKEAVIETLSMLSDSPATLFSSGYAAYSFMAFVLFAPPCVAALTAAYRELKSAKDFWIMLLFQFSAAYIMALIINVSGILIERSVLAFLSLTIIALGIIISIIALKRRGCGNCSACGGKRCKRKKANTTI